MATVTVTLATSMGTGPRQMPNGGVTTQYFASGNQTFGGAGDTMMLAKIPNNARIIDASVSGNVGATSVIARMILARADSIGGDGTLGTLSEMAEVLGTFTVATAVGQAVAVQGYPVVSLSDDAAVQFAVLAIKATGGTQSTSFSIKGVVVYECGGHAG